MKWRLDIPAAATVLGILVNLAVLAVFVDTKAMTNPASRFATIDSLAHRNTFAIDCSRYAWTIDKVRCNGRFVSSKPPMLATLAAVPYWWWVQATGKTFDTAQRASIVFVNFVTGLLPHLVLLLYMHAFLARWVTRPWVRAGGTLAFAFSYLGLAYAAGLNNHTAAAAALFAAFYHGFRVRHDPAAGIHHWVLAGLAAGLAPTLELWVGLFCVALAFALAGRDPRRTLLVFIPAALPALAIHFALTYRALGSLLPAYSQPQLYRYPGSYWNAPVGIDAVRDPKPVYGFHMLFGHHGLFSMTPVFVLSLAGAWYRVRGSSRGRVDTAIVFVPLAAAILLIGRVSNNYGGMCIGMRWLVLAMPLLFLFAASWLAHVRRPAWIAVFALCVLIGALNVWDALQEPHGVWRFGTWHNLLKRAGWGSVPANYQP